MSAQRPPALRSFTAPTGQGEHHRGGPPENNVRAEDGHPPGTKRIRPGVGTEADSKQTASDGVDATIPPTPNEPEVVALRHGYYAHYFLDPAERRRRLDDELAHAHARSRGAS